MTEGLDWQMTGTETNAAQHFSENATGKLYQKEQITLDGQGRREEVRNSGGDTKGRGGEGGGQGRRYSRSWSRYPPHCWRSTPEQVYPEELQLRKDPMLEQGKSMRKKEKQLRTDPSFHSHISLCSLGVKGRRRVGEEVGKERYYFNVYLCFSPPESIFIGNNLKYFPPRPSSLVCLWC